MSIPLQIATYTVALPAVLSGLVFAIAWQLEVRRSVAASYAAAIALGLGYIAGHVGTLGTPAYPPVEATQWLVYIAILGLVLGVFERRWHRQAWLRWGIRGSVVLVMGWLLLRPLISYSWSTTQATEWVLGLGAYVLASWWMAERLCLKMSAKRIGLLLILWGTAQSIAIVVSQSAVLAQLQGVLVSTIGVALVLAWVLPRAKVSLVSAAPLVALLFSSHAAAGFFYSELPAWSVVFLGLTPVLALLIWRMGESTKLAVGGFACAFAAAVAAVWIAVSNAPPSY